jgi:hypothetical protein
VPIFSHMPNFTHQSIFDAMCLTVTMIDRNYSSNCEQYLVCQSTDGMHGLWLCFGLVISLLDILRSILFIEHFDCESYVVNISLYSFHTMKQPNALMLKLYFVHTVCCNSDMF